MLFMAGKEMLTPRSQSWQQQFGDCFVQSSNRFSPKGTFPKMCIASLLVEVCTLSRIVGAWEGYPSETSWVFIPFSFPLDKSHSRDENEEMLHSAVVMNCCNIHCSSFSNSPLPVKHLLFKGTFTNACKELEVRQERNTPQIFNMFFIFLTFLKAKFRKKVLLGRIPGKRFI
jgi:hypothetical protein